MPFLPRGRNRYHGKPASTARGYHMALNELSQKELEKRIREASATGGIRKISDGEGLYLVHRANGGLSWQLDYSLNGVRRTFSMGTYPKVKLSTARTLAERARELVQLGQDPVEARRTTRQETQEAKTVSEVFHEWLEREQSGWSARHYSDYLQAGQANILVTHGAKRITELTEVDIRSILQRVEDRGAHYMLTRVRDVLVRTCQHALDRRYVKTNPAASVPRREYKTHQERHHPAIIVPSEFRELLLRTDREPGSIAIMGLRLQTLTFVRPQNIRSASWEHIDLESAVWDVPKGLTKKDRSFLVPLSKQAVELLRNWKTVTGGEPLIFPGTARGGQLSENTLNINLKRMGFAGRHSSHGFRASAKTLLEEGGFDSKYTKKQLAHDIDDKTERAYNRAEYWDIRVEMMQAWADYLDALRAELHQPYRWFADWRGRRSSAESLRKSSASSDQLSLGLETSLAK